MPRILTLIWQALLKLVGQQSATDKRLIELMAAFEAVRASMQQWQADNSRDHARLAEMLGQLIDLELRVLEAVVLEPAAQLQFSAILDDGTVQENITMLEMTYTQKATLTLTAVDAKGKPAVLDGAPEWLSGNTDLLQIQNISSDGMSAEAVAMGALGEGKITVTADAKLGPDVKPIIGSLDFRITPGEATQITVTAGAPVEQEG